MTGGEAVARRGGEARAAGGARAEGADGQPVEVVEHVRRARLRLRGPHVHELMPKVTQPKPGAEPRGERVEVGRARPEPFDRALVPALHEPPPSVMARHPGLERRRSGRLRVPLQRLLRDRGDEQDGGPVETRHSRREL